MSWATVTMAHDAEERAIITASMNAIGQAMSAWTQLLQHPADEAPNFRRFHLESGNCLGATGLRFYEGVCGVFYFRAVSDP
jgi:hypothetical protein